MYKGGLLIVVSAPSGTGKGTLIKHLMEKNNNIRLSVSATTRKPRQGEIEGQNYFYKSLDEFKKMVENDELIEWVEYCDNFYGTPRQYVDESLDNGLDVVLELEVEGAYNIRNKYPDCVLVFILPPSFDELRKRIENRGTENPEVILKRMDKARKEVTYINNYDYVIINDDISKAVDEINLIIISEKLRVKRNKDILKQLGI
jgi:guanylate kinase